MKKIIILILFSLYILSSQAQSIIEIKDSSKISNEITLKEKKQHANLELGTALFLHSLSILFLQPKVTNEEAGFMPFYILTLNAVLFDALYIYDIIKVKKTKKNMVRF